MKSKRGPGQTRVINGEKFSRPTRKYYSHSTAEHVASGHRGVGRKARIAPATCPTGKRAYVVYVRERRS